MGKKIIVTGASVRRDLQLDDVEGMDCLPNAIIFEELTRMGAKITAWNEFSSTVAFAIICLATNQKFNFSKYIFESMVKNLDNAGKFLMYPRFVQVFLNQQLDERTTHMRIYVTPSHTKKIFANMKRQVKDFSSRVTPLFPTMVVQAQEVMGEGLEMPTDPHYTPIITQPSSSQPQKKQKSRRPKKKDTRVSQPSDPINVSDEAVNEEPSMQLKELMDFCTQLQQRVLDLENTKTAQAQEITSLKLRVKRSARVISSDEASLGDQEDASKQGRKIDDIDKDIEITLVDETQGRYGDKDMFGVHDLDGDEVVVKSEVTDKAGEKRNIVEEAVAKTDAVTILVSAATITNVELTLAQTLAELKSARPKSKYNTPCFSVIYDISGGVDGPPVMPEDPYAYVVAAFQAPPSLDYVSGPEYSPSPDFVPEPVYPEFMPPEDEVLPAEEQPLPAASSPTIDSPGYVPESDPEEDPEEDDDEDPEEDSADYPADGGDDDDDEDESSDDDEDDDVDIEGDKEEEEHPDLADSIVVALPAVDQAISAEETEPFETDESVATPTPYPAYRVIHRMSIRDEPPTPFWSEVEVARLLAIPSPPPLPLSPWSSPLPQIPSPPLLVSPIPLLVRPTYLLGYRVAMIQLRAEAPSTSHSPPLHITLPHQSRYTTISRADRPKVTLPPRKRLGIAFGSRYEVGDSSSAPTARPPRGFRADYGFVATIDREIMRDLERDVGYGITNTWDEMLVDMPGAPAINKTKLGQRMTNFVTTVRQDKDEIYVRLDDEQTE
ncbi:hypothetical protein Tco_0652245 [Tanacetum coccineum]|uniref:Uncharacterized protein n=1 Tax=Tanacetum coccineum TaxID=301880 RepID=A0ABQ4WX17_9ASTR